MSLRHYMYGAVGLLAAALGISACDATQSGQPHSDRPSASASELRSVPHSHPTQHGAPQVDRALDVSTLETDPCTALSDSQREKLGLKSGEDNSKNSGTYCEYEYSNDSGNQVTVGVSNKLKQGLNDVYARRGQLAYFEPSTIDGYPAVYAAANADLRDEGSCQLYVGLTDKDVVRLTALLYEGTNDYPRGCDVAKLTAKTMIENLKGGS